ncbi:hypothetical protein AA0N74_08125 [Chromobacterium vaccinii]|uniref:phage tail tip fiber protein n=1 Tax=Chromobacterium vaccinii TaxID=1108595 RepID=UPI0031E443A7
MEVVAGGAAKSSDLTALQSTVGSNKAAADKQMTTLADADKALGLRVDNVTAAANTDRAAAQAGINEAKIAAADAKQSSAQSINQVNASLNSLSASVTQVQQATATLDGKVSSKWGVILETADAKGNRKVSGLQQFNDGSTSQFIITADQVMIGDFTNLCGNPSGVDGRLDGWVGATPSAISSSGRPMPWSDNNWVMSFSDRDQQYGNWFPVKPGDEFFVSADCIPAGRGEAPYPFLIGLQFAGEGVADAWISGAQAPPASGRQSPAGTLRVPSQFNRARVWTSIQGPHGHNSIWHVWNVQVRRKSTGNLLVDGAITTDKLTAGSVTADKIAANSVLARHVVAEQINTDHLAAGSITAVKIASNVITADKLAASSITTLNLAAGAVTTDKLASNSITTDKLAANSVTAANLAAGAISADKLASKSITADKLAVGSLDAITARIGTLRTATSGARTEISDNVIKVFDENGTLRVRLGNLSL